jgi:CCR4-NOT transcription complex subunit 4
LNGRCPACRRVYTAEAVEFKPVGPEEYVASLSLLLLQSMILIRLCILKSKAINAAEETSGEGTERARTFESTPPCECPGRSTESRVCCWSWTPLCKGRGDRRHPLWSYNETDYVASQLLPTLRSTEYFGKYGKITKIVLVKRKVTSTSSTPVVGLYITYHRREDAARAISAVDGSPSPGADGETMRASYGTTKYCMAFLRGVACTNQGCLELHEWGDERDCFTKEDLATLCVYLILLALVRIWH